MTNDNTPVHRTGVLFSKPEMEQFEILSNGMKLLQTDEAFRMSTDSILLADFCADARFTAVADLGCGGGTLGILLCAARPDCFVTGVELQSRACEIARKNVEINALKDRFQVIPADLRALDGVLDASSFDAVVSNPPYFPKGTGAVPPDDTAAIAKTERCCSFDELCAAAARLLKTRGYFCLVHRPERLAELFSTLRIHRLEPKCLRLVRSQPGKPVCLVLIQARLGASVGLEIRPDLILFDAAGAPTGEYRRIYHLP